MSSVLGEQNLEYQHRKRLEAQLADLIERVARLEATRPDQLLTQEQAAAYIGVKPPTLASWRHFGKGPKYRKVGRSAFYKIADVEVWLDKQVIVPSAA